MENPYTVREMVGFWQVVAQEGGDEERVLASCPTEDDARRIAEALWESLRRRS